MGILDIYTPGELNAIMRQRDEAAASSERLRRARSFAGRGEGLRLRLSKIPGVTKGAAARVLSDPYFFQCPPLDEFTVPTTRSVGSYTNYRGTAYTTRGGMAARTLAFRTLAVEWGGFVIEYDFDVDRLVKDLEEIVEAGWPIDVLATHQYNKEPEHHQKMFLTSVTKTENAGEVDARYLDLSFSQWRDPVTQRRGHSTKLALPYTIVLNKDGSYYILDKKVKNGRRAAPFKGPLTLNLIAKSVYGDVTRAVAVANRQKPPIKGWGNHTPLIKHPRFKGKGGKIIVPALDDSVRFSGAMADAEARGVLG